MVKYKDMFKKEIKEGDVIVHPITVNHETHIHNFTIPYYFDIKVVKRKGKRLIFDGIYCWGYVTHEFCKSVINLNRLDEKNTFRDTFLKMRELTKRSDKW